MAEKGRIKDIKDATGGNIIDRAGNDVPFVAYCLKQQSLNVGDMVRFTRVQIKGEDVCVDVTRSTVGTIQTINDDDCSGTIVEKEPNPKKFTAGKPSVITFYEPFLSQRGYMVGDMVHYDLVLNDAGETVAVNVGEN